MAVVTHTVTFALFMGGIALAWRTFPKFVPVALGVLCVVAAIMLRPRFAKAPKQTATAVEFPALHSIVAKVARTIGAPSVRYIVWNGSLNASIGKIGLGQHTVLTLGLPLMAILDSQERLALIAHELAHEVNGDPARGFLVHSSILTLRQWHQLLCPERLWESDDSEGGLLVKLGGLIGRVLMVLLSGIPWVLSWLLAQLLWRDSQRGEYLADLIAARVAGREAAVSLSQKTFFENAYRLVIQRISVEKRTNVLVAELRRKWESLPALELERIKRLNSIELARLDCAHPPEAFRIEFVSQQAQSQPRLTLSSDERRLLEQEISKAAPIIERQLLDEYEASLYG